MRRATGPWTRLLTAMAFLFAVLGTADAQTRDRDGREIDLALVLAIDISGSVDVEEGKMQREGYVLALRDPAIVRAILGGQHGRIAVAYFEWADSFRQRQVMDWTLLDSEAAIRAFADQLAAMPIGRAMRTSIAGAMRFAVPLFDKMPWAADRLVLDISGDGPNNDGGLITEARDALLAKRITINGLPIMNDRPNTSGFPNDPDLDRYYEGCVIGGARSFYIVAHGFEQFQEAIRKKLLQEIADFAPEPRAGRQFAQTGDHAMGVRDPHGPGPGGHRRYDLGCDIGEKRSREFWQRRSFQ